MLAFDYDNWFGRIGGFLLVLGLLLLLAPVPWDLGPCPTGNQDNQTYYRQPFVHDGENVSQEYMDSAAFCEVFSAHMIEKPSLPEFIKSAGSGGIVSTFATAVLLGVTVYEHLEKHDTPALILLILTGLFFCWGAYLAWANERRERIKLDALFQKADIRGIIQAASIDTKIYENGAWTSIEDGICLTVLVEAVNHSQVNAWNGRMPTVDISFGAKSYSGTFRDLPQSQYLLEFNEPTFKFKQITGMLNSVFIGGSDWIPAMPRYGYLCFVVPGVHHNVMKLDQIKASIVVNIHDTLRQDHPIQAQDILVGKELVRMYVPPA